MSNEDLKLNEESEILENSVVDVLNASDLLIHLVAKFINQTNCKDEEVRYEIQKAYNLISRGKKGLKKIGFIQEVH